MCFYESFIKPVIEVGSFALSTAALVFAYKIYKNFDVKKVYLNKQLDAVTNLTKEMNNSMVYFTFYLTAKPPDNYNGPTLPRSVTSYPLDYFSATINVDTVKFEKCYIRGAQILNLFSFLKFRHDPIMPLSIAKSLSKLYVPLEWGLSTQEDDLPNNYIVYSSLTPDKNDPRGNLLFEYKTTSEICSQVKNLRAEIKKWLENYGADEINF